MSDSNKSDNRTVLLVFLCLLAVNFIVYGPSLAFGFLVDSDDQAYIFRNPYLQDLTGENLWAIFSNIHYDSYNPVTLVSYSLDYSFWKFDPFGYHLTQILLHTLNACLAFVLLLNINIPLMAAVGAVMVYAVHPIHVESVVWIAERKNLLSSFFIFSSLIFYIRNARGNLSFDKNYWASLGLFVFALASKTIAVMLPVALVLYDRCIARRGWRVKEMVPFFIGSFVFALATIYTQGSVGAIKEYAGGSFWASALLTIRTYWDYLFSLVLPISLSPYYFFKKSMLWDWLSLFSYFFIPCSVFIAILKVNTRPWFAFAVGWFVLWLIPVSNIIPISTLRQDRYLYLPSLAVITSLMLMVYNSRWIANNSKRILVVSGVLVVLMGSLTVRYSLIFSGEKVFWGHVANKFPEWSQAQFKAGRFCWLAKSTDCAFDFYTKAVLAEPTHAKALNNLGAILIDRKEYASAKKYIERAQQADPLQSSVYKNLAVIANRTGEDIDKIPFWKGKFDEIEASQKAPEKNYRLGAFRFR